MARCTIIQLLHLGSWTSEQKTLSSYLPFWKFQFRNLFLTNLGCHCPQAPLVGKSLTIWPSLTQRQSSDCWPWHWILTIDCSTLFALDCPETMLDPQEQTPLLKDGNTSRSPLEGGALHRNEGGGQGERYFDHASYDLPRSHSEKDSTEKDMIMYPKPNDS